MDQRSEISNFLREDFNRIIECEFTLSNPRLEREGVPKYRDKMLERRKTEWSFSALVIYPDASGLHF